MTASALLVPAGPEAFFLEVGGGRWPLPLPIVKTDDGWKFDTNTGIRELVLRRIGRNELAVIGVCRGVVAAQQEYAAKFGAFATKLRSEPGKQDGLYWETKAGEPREPGRSAARLGRSAGLHARAVPSRAVSRLFLSAARGARIPRRNSPSSPIRPSTAPAES